MSALIAAASSEIMDRNAKLRATSGILNIQQQSRPLDDRK